MGVCVLCVLNITSSDVSMWLFVLYRYFGFGDCKDWKINKKKIKIDILYYIHFILCTVIIIYTQQHI